MKEPKYWNHNAAYYPWIKKTTAGCKCILDAACGDGSLLAYLDDGEKDLYGIDIDKYAIDTARTENFSEKTVYEVASFDEIDEKEKFDAIVFVTAIHHLDMTEAIRKVKKMLNPGGVLVIVGLAKPSTMTDRIIQIGRFIPSRIISRKQLRDEGCITDMTVSFDTPRLNDVRRVISAEIPYASWRQALHYRYLLKWVNE